MSCVTIVGQGNLGADLIAARTVGQAAAEAAFTVYPLTAWVTAIGGLEMCSGHHT